MRKYQSRYQGVSQDTLMNSTVRRTGSPCEGLSRECKGRVQGLGFILYRIGPFNNQSQFPRAAGCPNQESRQYAHVYIYIDASRFMGRQLYTILYVTLLIQVTMIRVYAHIPYNYH